VLAKLTTLLILFSAAVICIEFLVLLGLHNPSLTRFLPRFGVSFLWAIARRDIIPVQFLKDCGKFDPELFYTLKPGEFEFGSRGFKKNRFFANSLGLRDSEESLHKPTIIVLGDSYAMGWGVEQNQTFAKLLESQTRLKTLNCGISSYGTVREIKMLDRIDNPTISKKTKRFLKKGIFPFLVARYLKHLCKPYKNVLVIFRISTLG
jgi:hypothetical protein